MNVLKFGIYEIVVIDDVPYLQRKDLLKQIDGGYFVKILETISTMNVEEMENYLREEINNNRMKFTRI